MRLGRGAMQSGEDGGLPPAEAVQGSGLRLGA